MAHTHWDREWYHPFSTFRVRLVELLDELLAHPPEVPFLLDGQAVLLEDYLEIRPERAAELAEALRAGRLAAGPWLVLADELVPAPETLVRNLLAGRHTLARLRASPPPVLYCPDSFGHPAWLPALAAGFSMGVVVLWRGYGGKRWPAGDTVRWRAPDGSTVLLYHLPPSGYELGANLPSVDLAQVRAYWETIRAALATRSTLGVALLTCGADHHAMQRDLAGALARLSDVAAPDAAVVASSVSDFAAALSKRAAARALPVVSGELRDSYGYTWTLQGTLATRSALKRRFRRVERLLLRDTEPWAALAWLRSGRSSRALTASAWRSTLLAAPHDTLCGTVVDQAARAATARLEEAAATAKEVRDRALERILGHDREEIRLLAPQEWRHHLVVRNRSARPRSGVAEVVLDLPLARIPVGPGSAIGAEVALPAVTARTGLVTQKSKRERAVVLLESPRHYPLALRVNRQHVLVWTESVPGYGMVTYALPGDRRQGAMPVTPATAARRSHSISNGIVSVSLRDGALAIESPWWSAYDFLTFESEADDGDLYTPAIVDGTRLRASLSRSEVTAAGPLRAALETLWSVRRPPRESRTALGELRRVPRGKVTMRVSIELDAGLPFVRVRIEGENRASDHRLRCLVKGPLDGGRVVADTQFGPVARQPIAVDPTDAAMEIPLDSAPLHRYVSLFGERAGVTVHADGCTEYEALPGGILAVTLLRSVGELSRADLLERPGHAAYPRATPGAQELGRFRATIAIQPHGRYDSALLEEIERASDDFLAPLVGGTLVTARALPERVAGIELSGSGLAATTIKESECGQWLVMRCVNLRNEPTEGAWRVPGVREAWLARIDETPLALLSVSDGAIAFEALPRAIVTVLAR